MLIWYRSTELLPDELLYVLFYCGEGVLRCGYYSDDEWYVDGSPWIEPEFWAEVNWPV